MWHAVFISFKKLPSVDTHATAMSLVNQGSLNVFVEHLQYAAGKPETEV
jgi:hypothetical protein